MILRLDGLIRKTPRNSPLWRHLRERKSDLMIQKKALTPPRKPRMKPLDLDALFGGKANWDRLDKRSRKKRK